MTGSKPRSPLKIPSRPLSLSSRLSLSPIRSSFVQLSSKSVSADPKNDASNAPLPAFLKQTKSEISNTFVDLEWQQRHRLAAGAHPSDPPSQWARTQLSAELSSRNRYHNVEPFDNNRIRLKGAGEGDDYINASPIVLGDRRYISTQGPKRSSVSHFYRMVAQETSNTGVIVMLTQTHEAGKEKCWPYFPDEVNGPPLQLHADADSEDDGFEGEVQLLSSEEDLTSRSVIRRLKLRTRSQRKDSEEDAAWQEKEIWHLLFGGWPDFSVPEGEDRTALIELVALSRKLNATAKIPVDLSSFPDPPPVNGSGHAYPEAGGNLNPRIVHCSAGVGRSGTFIALDYLLALLEKGELNDIPPNNDPIAETVDRLRQQRMMMVQGESQFHFLYDTLREKWIERWRSQHV